MNLLTQSSVVAIYLTYVKGSLADLICFLYLTRFFLLHPSHWDYCKVNMALCKKLRQADVLLFVFEADKRLKDPVSVRIFMKNIFEKYIFFAERKLQAKLT